MALLDEAARTRIEAAVTEVEQHTSGEIVVVEVTASDEYAGFALRYAGGAALLAAIAAHALWPGLAMAWLLWLQAGVALAVTALFRVGVVVRTLVPEMCLTEQVERKAREAFFDHELFATRERTGVLILISELEHRVAILGDTGIDKRLHASGWHAHVQRMVGAIREGRAADGLCDVIGSIGHVLAEHLPARAGDTDELSNRVRIG